MTPRLIERWLPIAALGVESLRERTPMTPFPAPNRLHVWWARRPLVASRAAVLASILPANADREIFMRVLGIHGDPVTSRRRIDEAKRTGNRFEGEAYSYGRAFTYCPSSSETGWIASQLPAESFVVLDPTAGGGSIPFEAGRLGAGAVANDLNPVAAIILRATVEFPRQLGIKLSQRFEQLASEFVRRREERLTPYFAPEPEPHSISTNFLLARTIRCPHCDGLVPLSPTWNLSGEGTGVRLLPDPKARVCRFEIVMKAAEQSPGTVADGGAKCPFPGCGRSIDGTEIKKQAQTGGMGEQLYAVVYKRRVEKKTKNGRSRESWERGFRAPIDSDDVSSLVMTRLGEKMPEWESLDLVPSEKFPRNTNDDRPIQYGMPLWRDMFSPRQLLGHTTAVEIFRELLEESRKGGSLDDTTKAAFVYLSFSMDKMRDYNSRMTRWHSKREVVVNTFDRHDFSFKWSYAEMSPLVQGLAYDWAIKQTAKCIEELVELTHPGFDAKAARKGQGQLAVLPFAKGTPTPISVTNHSADSLPHLADASVDAVVMDPPYYDNVMYAELSDFFYVWLKRTAGHVYPELFKRQLTDKENEAVANPAKFADTKGARAQAALDYQRRMAAIFAECRRVLKPDGILTLMFTHKATGAWDALTSGLMDAGFTITASWPVNTESESSLHIKDKSAANSTIFLVCRPRQPRAAGEVSYWEDVEPLVGAAVRKRIEEFYAAGIRGVDLYLSCFGPALEEFANHWPLKRGQPRPDTPESKRKKRTKATDSPEDPYSVTPEDALDAARREVKKWRMDRILRTNRHADLDPLTEWFVLAWDSFKAPTFPYDEALRLARVVGLDLDGDVVGTVAEKKGKDLVLWDSAKRAAKGRLGPPDGSRALLDAFHHAAHRARTAGLDAAREQLETTKADQHPSFRDALAALLEVLPATRFIGEKDPGGPLGEAAHDFEVLEKLRRLAFSGRVPEPEQLEMFRKQAAG